MSSTLNTVDVKLDLAVDEPYSIVSCRITEGISELTHAIIELSSTKDIDFSKVLQGDAVLQTIQNGLPDRKWTLKVGRAGFVDVKEGSLRYRVDLFPHLWLLRHTLNTRKFRMMSSTDIVSKVLDEDHVKHEWRAASTDVRKYCVQYRESNLDFVFRLLEFEGIYYTFDDDGVMLLGDTSFASPTVEGNSHFELLEHAMGLQGGELGVHELRRGARVCSGGASVNDFNWKKPNTSLLKSAFADKDSELETYNYPEGYRRPDQGDRLSKLRLEAHRVPANYVHGTGNVTQFGAGRVFSFGNAGGAQFAGEYLLVSVRHEVYDPAYGERAVAELRSKADNEQTTYQNVFKGIPRNVPFRPEVKTPHPEVQGSHSVMVRGPSGEEIHTDVFGRFRAQMHWDREAKQTDEDSRWLRFLQESTSTMQFARVGWEVNVAYVNGDPDRPIGLSRDINGEMVPAYQQPAHMNWMTIKTPTSPAKPNGYNEIRLKDTAGEMQFDIKAERDYVTVVKNDRTETIGNDETHTVGEGCERNVLHDQMIKIGNNSKTTVSANLSEVIKADRQKTVKGNEELDIGFTLKNRTTGDDTEIVIGSRMCKTGTDGDGSVNRNAKEQMKRTIGGNYTITAKQNIQLTVAENFTETIGGDKTVTAENASIMQTISGPMTLDITGTVTRSCKKDMGMSSPDLTAIVGASASFTSDEKIEVRGDHIRVEAASKLAFTQGALEIALTPGNIAVKGKMRKEGGAQIVVTGTEENITP